MSRLGSIEFSDLFVHAQVEHSRIKRAPNSETLQPIPVELIAAAGELRTRLEEQEAERSRRGQRTEDFSLIFEGISYRVARMAVRAGVVYVLRRMATQAWPFDKLGFAQELAARLLDPELRFGLLLFSGHTGSGKTTAATSMIAQRLRTIGGLAWTVENPVELALEGQQGRGFCYQMEIDSDQEFGPAISRTLRGGSPDMIFIGEIRESSGAVQALRAAVCGHLVVATLHGSSVVASLERMRSLVRVGEGETAAAMLGDSLAAVLNLKLSLTPEKDAKGGVALARKVEVEALFADSDAIRSKIRHGNFPLLKTDIELQKARKYRRTAAYP